MAKSPPDGGDAKRSASLPPPRASGVLLHLTSLPGPFGIGDLGPSAHRFLDWMERAGQSVWQLLPLGPAGPGYSPYAATSVFAGNPLLVSPELLERDGLLKPAELVAAGARKKASARADFQLAASSRHQLLRLAAKRFLATRRGRTQLSAFRQANHDWLPDYALFTALSDNLAASRGSGAGVARRVAWPDWPAPLRDRDPGALRQATVDLADAIDTIAFAQLCFARQLTELRHAAKRRGIRLFGDLPIFVAHDSADVWQDRTIFDLDMRGRPRRVAGVPPDAFSKDGQRWDNPLYRWDVLRRRGYNFWIERLRKAFEAFDLVRLDHFIGFHRAWAIPQRATTAKRGRYEPGPGAHFFETVKKRLGSVELVAEDLGVVTPEVVALRDQFELPGMHVLQFSFAEDEPEARPFSIARRSVAYTGTHDNDTTVGWFHTPPDRKSPLTKAAWKRRNALVSTYLGCSGEEIHWDLLRAAWTSPAGLAIAPIQDVLGLGRESRMNLPGSANGNWAFRLVAGQLTNHHAKRLLRVTRAAGRLAPARTSPMRQRRGS